MSTGNTTDSEAASAAGGTAAGSVTQRLASWVAAATYENVPRRAIDEAKNQILSVLGSVHAGHFSEGGRTITRTVKEWGHGKDATLIPSGDRVSLHNAIFGNTALSVALDYDDYLFAGHCGHSAVLVTLAMAEKLGAGGKDLLLAQVMANEIGGRLAAAVMLGPLAGQAASFVHLAAGAVIAAKLLGLEAEQVESALGMALAQPTRPLEPGWLGSDAKLLLAATTAPAGVQAAQLVANGLSGCRGILEHPHGFLHAFTPQPLLEAFDGLGSQWLTDTVSFKMYPGSAHVSAAIDCALALQRQYSFDAKKISRVVVAAGPQTLEMEATSAPYVRGLATPPATLHATVGYNVAVALLDKEVSARQFTPQRRRDSAVWSLAARVQLVPDERIAHRARERSLLKTVPGAEGARARLALGPSDLLGFRASCGARVSVEMEDGRRFEFEQDVPLGAAGRPLDERRRGCEEKFRRETRYTLRKERIEQALGAILSVEQANGAGVRELVRLCCSERA